jgi:hypothetical protein
MLLVDGAGEVADGDVMSCDGGELVDMYQSCISSASINPLSCRVDHRTVSPGRSDIGDHVN